MFLKLLSLLLLIQVLCTTFSFISILSPSFLKIDSKESDDSQTYGIFTSCYIGKNTQIWHEKEYETTCKYCLNTDDALFVNKVSLTTLRGAKCLAVFSMISSLVAVLIMLVHIPIEFFNVHKVPWKVFYALHLISSVIQWVLFLSTLILTSVFMNQISVAVFENEEHVSAGVLDFGYGKVIFWITWICLFVPAGIAGFMNFVILMLDRASHD